MEKQLHLKLRVLVLILFFHGISYTQEIVPFEQRKNLNNFNGDVTMIGNAIIGLIDNPDSPLGPNGAYNGDRSNGGLGNETAYINIDGDDTTFSSSSADFTVPSPECSTIEYAGLYWSAVYYLNREAQENPKLSIGNGPLMGDYPVVDNNFDPGHVNIPVSPGITANLVFVEDDAGSPYDACSGLINAAEIAGNIALIVRGSCAFDSKIIQAQNAGAVAVIVVDNQPTGAIPLVGSNENITIPAVSIDFQTGQQIFNELANGPISATLVNEITNDPAGNEQLVNLPLVDARKVGSADFRNIKFKAPGGSYATVTAQDIIYDGYANTPTNQTRDINDIDGDGDTTEFVATDNVPYVCYAEVTNLINQNNINGTYTIADMKATVGQTSTVSGAAGGWVLVLVYKDPSMPVKTVSINDGFGDVSSTVPPIDFKHTGLTSIPEPSPVRASYGIAGLEGDYSVSGDELLILNTPSNFTRLSSLPANSQNNFFNSSISIDGENNLARNPASANTLGFDIDFFQLGNDANNLIGNDQSEVTFRVVTNQDTFNPFLSVLSIDNVIVPKLQFVKRIFDKDNVDITDGLVELGDEIFYDLQIENTGDEDITNVVITDVLPDNVDFIENSVTAPEGVVGDYNANTRTVSFTIPDNLVEQSDVSISIRYQVALVLDCGSLRDTCSSIVSNRAIADFSGVVSGFTSRSTSSSGVDTCGMPNSMATQVEIGFIPACTLDVGFCGGLLQLSAQPGYDQYTWSGPAGFSAVTTTNTLDIPSPETGVYVVVKEDTNPADGTCQSLSEEFNVNVIADIPHPLQDDAFEDFIDYFDDTNGGCVVPLARINLCGDQSYTVDSGFSITNVLNITWQELTNASCFNRDDECPAIGGECENLTNWTDISTTPLTTSLEFTNAGEYRMVVEFDSGCAQVFYFDINKNDYQPQVDVIDIQCDNDGLVQVNNIPPGGTFRYLIRPQLDPAPTVADVGLFTNTNGLFVIPFDINPFVFSVYAIDSALPNCVYTVDGIVRTFDPQVAINVVSPTCINNDNLNGLGSIQIEVTGGLPSYEYRILGGPDNINIVTGSNEAINSNFVFEGLKPGLYTVQVVSNQNPSLECLQEFTNIVVEEAPPFTAIASIVSPPTCDTGGMVEVVVTAGSGGPYSFADETGVFNSPAPGDPQDRFLFNLPKTVQATDVFVFRINDINSQAGCIIETQVNGQDPYIPIEIQSITPIDPVCPSDTGMVKVELTSGSTIVGRIFTYELVNPNGTTIQIITDVSTSITFANVPPVSGYTVRVADNNLVDVSGNPICEEVSASFDVTQPEEFLVQEVFQNSVCNGNDDGSIMISATGGTAPYTYSLSSENIPVFSDISDDIDGIPGAHTFEDLAPGNYTIQIVDFVGCTQQLIGVIEEPEALQASIVETTPETCASDSDGTITIKISGGTPPYRTNITNNDADFVENVTNYTNLPTGVTVVYIADANNCRLELSSTIEAATPVSLETIVTPVTNEASGLLEVTATGGIAPYRYTLRNPAQEIIVSEQNENILVVDLAGNYELAVSDANGCITTSSVTVDGAQVSPLLQYADEILFCAIIGQSYPVITIQDSVGEVLEIPAVEEATIVWQKLDDISCTAAAENTCPTTNTSCSSSWFDITTGTTATIAEEGQYRVVINFSTKNRNNTIIYYFKTVSDIPNITEDLVLYPNPTKGQIQFNKEVRSIEVFDMKGRKVLSTSQSAYDVTSLRNGVYFVKVITSDNKEIITKLIRE